MVVGRFLYAWRPDLVVFNAFLVWRRLAAFNIRMINPTDWAVRWSLVFENTERGGNFYFRRKIVIMFDYSIAKLPYKIKEEIQEKVLPEDWIALVESKNEMIWIENTDLGHDMPESRKKRIAMAEWDSKKNYFHLKMGHYNYGYVKIQVNSVITPKRLRYLLELSKELNALLLKNGTKVIDEVYSEQIENKKMARKREKPIKNE